MAADRETGQIEATRCVLVTRHLPAGDPASASTADSICCCNATRPLPGPRATDRPAAKRLQDLQ